MKRILLTAAMVAVSSGFATGQWWYDDFNSNTLTGWTLDKGAWTATNMEAHSQASSTWQYATRADHNYQNCSVECDATHPGGGLAFAGVALRVNDPAGGSLGQDLIMVKLQGSTSWTDMWLYSLDASGARLTSLYRITTGSVSGRVRLSAIGSEVIAEWDTDQDGVWDHSLRHTTNVAVKAGPVGINGFSAGIVDNFKVFNAAIMMNATSPAPNPGSTVLYDIGGLPNDSYQGAISLGNLGVPVGTNQSLPLTADTIFLVSAQNLLGNLGGVLDAAGTATLGFSIPNLPQLTGLSYYTAFVTFDNTGLTGVSNDIVTTIS